MSKLPAVILIAEDDNRTREALVNSLGHAGYQVIAAADGEEALALFQSAGRIDLVVLDVLMPRLDGFQVCQAIRAASDVPIIMATILGSPADRITGLEMGANDYLVKPFATKELLARIRNILRRTPRSGSPEADSSPPRQAQKIGPLTIEPLTRKAYRDSRDLRLTELEFRLLALLASEPGRIFSRLEILQALWGYDESSTVDTKTVDVHISRLRIKLADNTRHPQFIVTIRARGYMFLLQRSGEG